jgi:hypothetical protein
MSLQNLTTIFLYQNNSVQILAMCVSTIALKPQLVVSEIISSAGKEQRHSFQKEFLGLVKNGGLVFIYLLSYGLYNDAVISSDYFP